MINTIRLKIHRLLNIITTVPNKQRVFEITQRYFTQTNQLPGSRLDLTQPNQWLTLEGQEVTIEGGETALINSPYTEDRASYLANTKQCKPLFFIMKTSHILIDKIFAETCT